jgi:hypothetical protein
MDKVLNKKYIDPIKQGEPRFVLFSYIKSKDAVPDKDGYFGVGKVRGVCYTEPEAASRAEEIIRDVDSTNSIYTCLMGVPFPIVDKGHCDNVSDIDIKNKVETTISENVRAKRIAEQKEMQEIKEREQSLMDENGVSKDISQEEQYIQNRVKLAHLRYAVNEHTIKIKECKDLTNKVVSELLSMKSKNPEYEEHYLERYKQGRRKVGIPENTDLTGFMKYMADPIESEECSYIS